VSTAADAADARARRIIKKIEKGRVSNGGEASEGRGVPQRRRDALNYTAYKKNKPPRQQKRTPTTGADGRQGGGGIKREC